MTETWLETDTETTDATGSALGGVLHSIATTLENAPDGKRYDMELNISERDTQ